MTALREMRVSPTDTTRFVFPPDLDITAPEQKGRDPVLQRYLDETLWNEDVMLLNIAGLVFR